MCGRRTERQVNPQDGQVAVGVRAHDARMRLPPIGQRHLNRVGARDHVVIGQNIAVGAHNHPRAQAGGWTALRQARQFAKQALPFPRQARRVDLRARIDAHHGRRGGGHGLGINLYEHFIQTDAAINPGNSGGALIDVHGRLVGINTAIYSETGGSLGIGFAIPTRMATAVLEQILQTGRVTRGWLGIEPQDITPELARAFRLAHTNGVMIAGVLPNGPAARAGVQPGDVVLRLDDAPVTDSIGLLNQIAPLTPGSRVRLALLRDGNVREVQVVAGRRPGRG